MNTVDNKTVKDLADEVNISQNGLVYTVHIKDDATFQDDTHVTADDVVFTIQKFKIQI